RQRRPPRRGRRDLRGAQPEVPGRAPAARRHARRPRTDTIAHLAETAAKLIHWFQRDEIWAAVAALADQLDAHDQLDHEEVAEVLEAWLP
ncbi:MAG: hypothetical protein AAF191_13160, partial [Verrucomicrobiota bacterium]